MLLASAAQVERAMGSDAIRIAGISTLNASSSSNFATKVLGVLRRTQCRILSPGFSTGQPESQKWYFATTYGCLGICNSYTTGRHESSSCFWLCPAGHVLVRGVYAGWGPIAELPAKLHRYFWCAPQWKAWASILLKV